MKNKKVSVVGTVLAGASPSQPLSGVIKKLSRVMASSPNDAMAVIDFVRKGMEYLDFITISHEVPFSIKEWSNFLHLSERTLQRYEKENRYFEPEQTEKIISVSLLYNKGTAIFGSTEKLNIWLDTQSVALGGNKPKDLLDSNIGIQLVDDELGRIEHGIFS